MSDAGSNSHRDAIHQEATGAGQQPALGIDLNRSIANPNSVGQDVGKVFDLDSFRRFVRQMADRHLNGGVSREDTLSMVRSVATHRKLNGTFGDDEVCNIIHDEFCCLVDAATNCPDADAEPESSLGVITADRLQAKRFRPVMFLLPPLVAEGVTRLAGKPKLGKSWLTLDIAQAVARGTPVLGTMPTPGKVLGLFLEDSERRLQARLAKLQIKERLGQKTCRWRHSGTVSMRVTWPTLRAGVGVPKVPGPSLSTPLLNSAPPRHLEKPSTSSTTTH